MDAAPKNHYIYRCALSLNNMGLTLLERGHAKAALETFKDSVDVMKWVVPNEAVPAEAVETRLRRAAKKAALAAHKDCENDTQDVVIVSLDGEASSIRNLLLDNGSCKFFAGRLEVTDLSERNFDLDSAVILNNFAVAHMCMLEEVPCEARGFDILLNSALKIFGLTRTILVNQFPDSIDSIENILHILSSAIVVRNTIQVSRNEYIEMKPADVMHNMNLLHTILEELDQYSELTIHAPNCAARAA
jgi:hypothetical protein